MLHRFHQVELKRQLGSITWKRLEAWAAKDATAPQSQKQLQKIWKLSQPAVSQILQDPGIAVAIEALPRHGNDPIQYLLTGAARLTLLGSVPRVKENLKHGTWKQDMRRVLTGQAVTNGL
ncbi:MAG: hypothetical protein OXF67_05405 [Cyanobacteria bacterium MAG CAR4_bin_6]|nr:hypothetical protein [Cyanobacteria bacterium MAG CAR4_bin_6]